MKVPVISIIVVSVAIGLSMPVFADKKQAREEQVCIEDLKVAAMETMKTTETRPAKKDLVAEANIELDETERLKMAYKPKYDFNVLREENEDIIAWINIPGTKVDYPILFDGTDKYLHTNLNGEDSVSGSIYVDMAASNVLDDEINIIYGHHMKNGSMFADIDEFSEKDFWDGHPEVNIFLEDRELRLTPIMSVVGASDTDLREVKDVESLKAFCEDKAITNGKIPEEWTQMYVLVTCNYTGNNYKTYLFCGR